jgi:hypothetical protein
VTDQRDIYANVLETSDGILKWKMARGMYLAFCQNKGFDPYAEPYVPAWAIQYAQVALEIIDNETDTDLTVTGEDEPVDSGS